MARKRMIDPSFWEDLAIGQLSRNARLCFIGLMSYADDEGRVQVDPRYVKRAVFGFDDDLTTCDVGAILDELRTGASNLVFYDVAGRQIAAFSNWRRYQYIQKPQPSNLPPPPTIEPSVNGNGPLSEEYVTATVPVSTNRTEQKGIEQNGGEARARADLPPPSFSVVDELIALGLNREQARLAAVARAFTPAELEAIKEWLKTCTANKPMAVLWMRLRAGLLPDDLPRPPEPELPPLQFETLPDGRMRPKTAADHARIFGSPPSVAGGR